MLFNMGFDTECVWNACLATVPSYSPTCLDVSWPSFTWFTYEVSGYDIIVSLIIWNLGRDNKKSFNSPAFCLVLRRKQFSVISNSIFDHSY